MVKGKIGKRSRSRKILLDIKIIRYRNDSYLLLLVKRKF